MSCGDQGITLTFHLSTKITEMTFSPKPPRLPTQNFPETASSARARAHTHTHTQTHTPRLPPLTVKCKARSREEGGKGNISDQTGVFLRHALGRDVHTKQNEMHTQPLGHRVFILNLSPLAVPLAVSAASWASNCCFLSSPVRVLFF